MTELLLVMVINGIPVSQTIQYTSKHSCSNAKEEFVLAFSPNDRQSTSDETSEGSGYELYDNADVKLVSAICTNTRIGSIF